MKKKKKEIEDIAFDIQLQRKERSYAFGEARSAGALAFHQELTLDAGFTTNSPLINTLTLIDTPVTSVKESEGQLSNKSLKTENGNDEVISIRNLVVQFENLKSSEVVEQHGKITLTEYTSISNGQVNIINLETLKKWVASQEFISLDKIHGSDKIDFVNFDVSLIDGKTASVNYSIFQSNTIAQSAIIAVKDTDNIWKVAVHCQHPVTI